MKAGATTRSLLVALVAAIIALFIADSRYAIADTAQPADPTRPTLVDPVPTPVAESPLAEPAQPVNAEPTSDNLSAIGHPLSAMEYTIYLPVIQRAEKYPPANRAYELEVLRLVNEQRAAAGLWPLIEDPALTQAARRHAMDMAVNNAIGHTGSDGSTHFQRMLEEGFAGTPWTEAAGWGYTSPEHVVRGWMDSPAGHRYVILDRTSNYIGMGVYPIAAGAYAGTSAWVITLGVYPEIPGL